MAIEAFHTATAQINQHHHPPVTQRNCLAPIRLCCWVVAAGQGLQSCFQPRTNQSLMVPVIGSSPIPWPVSRLFPVSSESYRPSSRRESQVHLALALAAVASESLAQPSNPLLPLNVPLNAKRKRHRPYLHYCAVQALQVVFVCFT